MKQLLILIAVVLTSSAAGAQSAANGSVSGVVRDEQGAVLPGVTLTASSPATPQAMTALSEPDGTYRLSDLPPGEYRLTAELQGFARTIRDGVLVRAGMSVVLDVALRLGSMNETVEVKGDAPLLEATSTVQAVNISGDLQRSLPIASRGEWHEFMGLAPGVVSYQTRFTGYFVHGADEISSTYQLDGASITSGLQSSNFFTQLSTETIEDTQIKTGGVSASSPLGIGAVVNIVSKSATNQFRGTGALTYRPKRWNDNNTPGGTSVATSMVQPDVSMGGPLVKDGWWGFGTYRHAHIKTGISRGADQVATLSAIAPGFVPFDDPNDADFWFLKSSAQIVRGHLVDVWFQNDRNPSGLSQPFYSEPLVDLILGGSVYTARMSSVWGPSVTSRLLVSYNNKTNSRKPVYDDVTGRLVHQRAILSAGRLRGTGPIALLDNANLQGTLAPYHYWTISGDLHYFKQGWLGSHEIETGVYLQPWYHEERQFSYANNGFYLEELVLRDAANPAAGLIPFHRQIYAAGSVTNLLLDTSDHAFYVQDAWKPASRLTINAGVRVDLIHRLDVPFDVVVEDSVEVGPRIGVNYALTADRRNLVRASWSRVHDNLTNTATNAGANTSEFSDLYDNDLNGSFETVFVTPGRSGTATDRIIDPGYHQSYINESIVGFSRQLPARTTLSASFIRREFRDRPALVDTNGIYEGNVFKGYRNEAFNEIYLLTNNGWNWPVYKSIDLEWSTQTSTLQLLGNYSRQWRHLAGTWQPSDPASFIQPDAFANDKGIGSTRTVTISQGATGGGGDSNSLSGTSQTASLAWRDHLARFGVSWRAPADLVVAANYTFQSGLWSGPVVKNLPAPDPAFGPTTVRLSNGRMVTNPLSTTIRFANATRGEGQLQTPSMHALNLRLGRNFPVGSRRLETAIDLFNIANAGADQDFRNPGANQQFSPQYTLTMSRQPPRSGQVMVRFVF
jgi:hypothetical protein